MKKKEKITLGVIALLLIVTIIGVSYAAFTFAQSGKNLNTMTTGIMQMSYEESSNIIKMTGALPTTDATGKVRLNKGEYFDFTVSSTIQGEAQINWEIAAEDFSSNTFDGSHVKLYLTSIDSSGKETEVMAPKVFTKKTTENKKTGRPANMMSLATGTMSASTSTKYRLRMWVDENYNPQGDGGGKKFAVRINVYGKVAEEVQGSKMKAYNFIANTNYANVTRVVTQNTLTKPSNVTYSEDLSAKGDRSVMAYIDGNNTLTIAGKDGIVADAGGMYLGLSKVTSIDLTYLDTSKVTNMSAMFGGCSNLTSLDLSNFDTSKVTDMSGMFSSCRNLTSLDLANFITSNVTNMQSMFSNCSSLTSLDLANFVTSNVTNMEFMFQRCSSLTSLDVSSFNTSNVTGMNSMFSSCSSLTSLDLSNFDTSNVTGMLCMFDGCSSLTSLDVSNFDTSKVISMREMFYGCSSLTSLDLSSFNTAKVTQMNSMFRNCSKMQSIKVGSKWVIGSGCNTTSMFSGCGVSAVTVV